MDYAKETMKLLESISRYSPLDVFRDYVALATISISNQFYRSEEQEERYKRILSKYRKEEQGIFPKLLAFTVGALEEEHRDFLGEIFMLSDFGSKHKEQYFTPFHISYLNAKLILGDVNKIFEEREYIKVSEPSCGSGGKIIAADKIIKEAGYNTARKMFVQAIDIDSTATDMCYIQLSLYGIPAEVITGDTLSLQFERRLFTPTYFIEGWYRRLQKKPNLPPKNEIINPNATDLFGMYGVEVCS